MIRIDIDPKIIYKGLTGLRKKCNITFYWEELKQKWWWVLRLEFCVYITSARPWIWLFSKAKIKWTTMCYHHIPVRLANIKRQKTVSTVEGVGKSVPKYTFGK